MIEDLRTLPYALRMAARTDDYALGLLADMAQTDDLAALRVALGVPPPEPPPPRDLPPFRTGAPATDSRDDPAPAVDPEPEPAPEPASEPEEVTDHG